MLLTVLFLIDLLLGNKVVGYLKLNMNKQRIGDLKLYKKSLDLPAIRGMQNFVEIYQIAPKSCIISGTLRKFTRLKLKLASHV